MNSALFIGATGMKSLSEGMNVITNNLANVSTIGYKQQDIQFSDLMYQTQAGIGNSWEAQEDSKVAIGQMGMGVQVDNVRTLFQQGPLELGSAVTDLALTGTGFFQVQDEEGNLFYTRAGNFRFDEEGYMELPTEEHLMGYPLDEAGNKGALGDINLAEFEILAPKATSTVTLGFNFGSIGDMNSDPANPYFSMAQNYDGTQNPPLSEDSSSYQQQISVIDAEGNTQYLNLYVDGAPSDLVNPNTIMEFVIGTDPNAEGEPGQALLSGTLTFNSSGELVDMSAFSPTGDTTDLANWTPATLTNGSPTIDLNGQIISLNFGLTAGGEMEDLPASAADVGTDPLLLGTMGTNTISTGNATTALAGIGNSLNTKEQDGYAEGYLTSIEISDDGTISARYSNSQTVALYEIPVARFTSEDGLRREGGNLFSYTEEAGAMDLGKAGTENYASMQANYIEGSNVDMASEMVDMIITQRGFQSNSKVVTTADEMLKKAMELKR